jgi:hypothetical protein
MTETRFPDAPPQIAGLPVEERGFPVPFFVPTVNGKPEFRAVAPERVALADRKGLCWICGKRLNGLLCFTVGPMCCVNRVSSEPPAHPDCAAFAVVACPFLSRPGAKRRPVGDEFEHQGAPGVMLAHNPGMIARWHTRSYRSERQGSGPRAGLLFRMGPPVKVLWSTEGRDADRAEVLAAIERGLPALANLAKAEGPEALAELEKCVTRALKWAPA